MEHDGGGEEPLGADLGAGPRLSRRRLALLTGGIIACLVIAVNVFLIQRAGPREEHPQGTSSALASASKVNSPMVPRIEDALPALSKNRAVDAPFEKSRSEQESNPEKSAPHFATVREAVLRSCTTASVEGLSRQIIEQARCLAPNAFVPLPSRPNLELASNVFPFLEVGARDHLLRALDSRKDRKMTINSAFRTVAQQYLVWRWSANRRCGVALATPPGESNHEVGRALDIVEQAEWRKTLEAQDFRWLGRSDPVHFDYEPRRRRSTAKKKMLDVLAFQKLWNRNNRKDRIAETGRYNAATEVRLKKSPPSGFPIGASCKEK